MLPAIDAPPASFWRRLMGMAYEGVILFGVVFFVSYGFSALARFQGAPGVTRWVFQGFLFVVLGAYFTYFWSEGRRTLPMKTLTLLLVDRAGAPLTGARAFARYLSAAGWLGASLAVAKYAGAAPGAALALLPLAWVLFDRERRALYDVIAGTRLLVVPLPAHVQTQST